MKIYSIKLFYIFIIISIPLLLKAQADDYLNFSEKKETLSVKKVNNQHICLKNIWKNPYFKATTGNLSGMIIGGIIGGFVTAKAFASDTRDKPYAGLDNIGYVGFGVYTGSIIGAATGTTIALGSGLTMQEKGIIFSMSIAPHLVHYGILLNDKTAPAHSKPFKVSFGISFPLSIALPAYYKKCIKTKGK